MLPSSPFVDTTSSYGTRRVSACPPAVSSASSQIVVSRVSPSVVVSLSWPYSLIVAFGTSLVSMNSCLVSVSKSADLASRDIPWTPKTSSNRGIPLVRVMIPSNVGVRGLSAS